MPVLEVHGIHEEVIRAYDQHFFRGIAAAGSQVFLTGHKRACADEVRCTSDDALLEYDTSDDVVRPLKYVAQAQWSWPLLSPLLFDGAVVVNSTLVLGSVLNVGLALFDIGTAATRFVNVSEVVAKYIGTKGGAMLDPMFGGIAAVGSTVVLVPGLIEVLLMYNLKSERFSTVDVPSLVSQDGSRKPN